MPTLRNLKDVANYKLLTGTSLGAFTGTVIPDNSSAKQALQALETSTELKFDKAGGIISGDTRINGTTLFGDTNYFTGMSGPNPLTRYSTNAISYYERSTNTFVWQKDSQPLFKLSEDIATSR